MFECLHRVQLQLMEALLAAGYRPVTFRCFQKSPGEPPLPMYFPPADPELAGRWELDTGSRWAQRAGFAAYRVCRSESFTQ